jgi:hypothetical protein
MMGAPALVLLALLTASAGPGSSVRTEQVHVRPAPLGDLTTAPAVAAAPSAARSPTSFGTIPPGSSLPNDETCTQLTTPAPEVVPANAPYNARSGSRRLTADFFPEGGYDPRAGAEIAPRVSGNYTGTTPEILSWTACKWGIDQRVVDAQTDVESSWQQKKTGDWTTTESYCPPGHGLGVDGRPGQCPESWGVLQVRYRFFTEAFPDAITSTAFNADTAYAVWRSCYEGYEWWLRDVAPPDHPYGAGDMWGCVGRWYSGDWYSPSALRYIDCVQRIVDGRPPCQ